MQQLLPQMKFLFRSETVLLLEQQAGLAARTVHDQRISRRLKRESMAMRIK
jgi:hypothetical protein